MQVENSQY